MWKKRETNRRTNGDAETSREDRGEAQKRAEVERSNSEYKYNLGIEWKSRFIEHFKMIKHLPPFDDYQKKCFICFISNSSSYLMHVFFMRGLS